MVKRKFEFFSKDEIKEKKLLYIFIDTKRVRVVEFVNGKKKVLLNKEREIKKVNAGGMSKKRYRRIYGEQKGRTVEWHTRQLEKLENKNYDKMRLIVRNEEWEENALNILKNKIKWKELEIKKDEKE